MQISSVNNINNSAVQKQKSNTRSFGGLWGKTSFITDYDPVLSVPKIEITYYYYPFDDEKQEDIDLITKTNSSAEIVDNSKYIVKDCRQCYTLPFKESDYNEYIKANLSRNVKGKMRKIHYNVKDKYTNLDVYENQKSAANPNISRILDVQY